MTQVGRDVLFEAIRASWSRESSADPDRWDEANPALGQCEVTSLVILEYLGGDLQLSRVFVDGELSEHHHHNLLGPDDTVDLTAEQFAGHEEFEEVTRLEHDMVRTRFPELRAEIRDRYDILAPAVVALIGPPASPLIT